MEKTYAVEGMKCQGCVDTVTEKLSNVSGVKKAFVSLDNNSATVSGDFNDADIKNSLNDTNYSIK
ncbi:heavy-metal-associated domain-containing protein [Companilactobacillus baiquanensis]|uniref:Heavy-metal-associated domain-containing protein n=1 Tax=Companilactobacillus baiquanensis TaxID=2486005 RepID=A0ABW1USL0_9LACO|nr:heavy-metal-associated domain-containing protein [Companilactobacillus baiquanensis]